MMKRYTNMIFLSLCLDVSLFDGKMNFLVAERNLAVKIVCPIYLLKDLNWKSNKWLSHPKDFIFFKEKYVRIFFCFFCFKCENTAVAIN